MATGLHCFHSTSSWPQFGIQETSPRFVASCWPGWTHFLRANSVVKTAVVAVDERRQDVLESRGEAKYSSEEINEAMLKGKKKLLVEKAAAVNR